MRKTRDECLDVVSEGSAGFAGLTAIIVLNEYVMYAMRSPRPMRIDSMSFFALVAMSPEPTLSKNAGSWTTIASRYLCRTASDSLMAANVTGPRVSSSSELALPLTAGQKGGHQDDNCNPHKRHDQSGMLSTS